MTHYDEDQKVLTVQERSKALKARLLLGNFLLILSGILTLFLWVGFGQQGAGVGCSAIATSALYLAYVKVSIWWHHK